MWETASRMTEQQQQQEIVNSSESRCSFKIESNSRGNNYTTHIYGQCSQEEINDCIIIIKCNNFNNWTYLFADEIKMIQTFNDCYY